MMASLKLSAGFRFSIVAILGLLSLSFQAKAITLDFQSLDGTVVNFAGNSTFNFTSTNGYQFSISSVIGGVGDSVGLNGYVAPGGPFTIGGITTNGGLQSASVTGTSTLHITDKGTNDLTGTITWISIGTVNVLGVLDLNGQVNLSNIAYPVGTNNDLGALAAAGSGEDVVTFQFVPAKDLTTLATVGGFTSYSGSITSVPEPNTMVLALAGIFTFLSIRRRK
jgi:hypothetical protein